MVTLAENKSRLVPPEETVRKIKDIYPRFEPTVVFKDESEIDDYVEKPLREACKILYRKNIETIWSSADREDKYASIVVVVSNMSPENQATAKKLGLRHNKKWGSFDLKMPINPEMEVAQVEQHFVAIAEQFKEQPMTWAPTYCFAEYVIHSNIFDAWEVHFPTRESALRFMIEKQKLFFDPDEGLFYDSETLYRKSHPGYEPGKSKPIDYERAQFDHWQGRSWMEIVEEYKSVYKSFKEFSFRPKPPPYLDCSSDHLLPKWVSSLSKNNQELWRRSLEMLDSDATAEEGDRLGIRLMDNNGYSEILRMRREMDLLRVG